MLCPQVVAYTLHALRNEQMTINLVMSTIIKMLKKKNGELAKHPYWISDQGQTYLIFVVNKKSRLLREFVRPLPDDL